MIVHVEPGECRADEFRLKLLFETGTCVFSTPHELWSFWTGPVAEAFGIEPTQGAIVAPDPDTEDDDATLLDIDAHDAATTSTAQPLRAARGRPDSPLTAAG